MLRWISCLPEHAPGSCERMTRNPSTTAAPAFGCVASLSISHAAWDVHAVHGVHARYSVGKLGAACGQPQRAPFLTAPWPFPGSLMDPHHTRADVRGRRVR